MVPMTSVRESRCESENRIAAGGGVLGSMFRLAWARCKTSGRPLGGENKEPHASMWAMAQVGGSGVPRIKVEVSATWTARWAEGPYVSWPCSVLAGRQVEAELDGNGLLEISPGDLEIPADELTTMLAAALVAAIPADLLAAMDEERGNDP